MAVAEEIRHAVELRVSLAALTLCISCVAWKLEAINYFRRCHVRSILKVVGRISITQLTSMASQWGPDAGVDGKALCLVLEKNSVIWRRPEIKNRNHFVTGTNFVRRCS